MSVPLSVATPPSLIALEQLADILACDGASRWNPSCYHFGVSFCVVLYWLLLLLRFVERVTAKIGTWTCLTKVSEIAFWEGSVTESAQSWDRPTPRTSLVRRADLRQTVWGGSSQSRVSGVWCPGPGPRKCCQTELVFFPAFQAVSQRSPNPQRNLYSPVWVGQTAVIPSERVHIWVWFFLYGWYYPGVRIQMWVCSICVISPYSTGLWKLNGAVKFRLWVWSSLSQEKTNPNKQNTHKLPKREPMNHQKQEPKHQKHHKRGNTETWKKNREIAVIYLASGFLFSGLSVAAIGKAKLDHKQNTLTHPYYYY